MNRASLSLACLALAVALAAGACASDRLVDGSLAIDIAVDDVIPRTVPSRGGTEVTVLGSNFPDGTTVRVGTAAPPGLVRHDDTRLTFVAPPMTVGRVDVVVQTPNGQQVQASGALAYYAEQVAFASETVLFGPGAIAMDEILTGDLDGDGRDDVLALTSTAAGAYALQPMLNVDGGRRLRPGPARPIERPTVQNDALRLLADVNGDGRADLVDYRNLYLTGEDGAIGAPVPLVTGADGEYVWAAVAADFDGDGRIELAVYRQAGPADPGALVLVQVTAAGALEPRQQVDAVRLRPPGNPLLEHAYRPRGTLLARDVNGDGLPDLIYQGEDQLLHVRLGPDLATESWRSPASPQWWVSYVSFDLVANADGAGPLSLIAVGGTDSVATYADAVAYDSNGDGTFGSPRPLGRLCGAGYGSSALIWTGSPQLTALACTGHGLRLYAWYQGLPIELGRAGVEALQESMFGELDGLPGVDLVYVRGSQTVVARYGTGDGWWSALTRYWGLSIPEPAVLQTPTSMRPTSLAVGDFGDLGRLAVAWDQWVTLAGVAGRTGGAGTADPTQRQAQVPQPTARVALDLGPGQTVAGLVACDVDRDGHDEIVALVPAVPGGTAGFLQIIRVEGGALVAGARLTPDDGAYYERILAVDLDGDSHCDLLWLRVNSTIPLRWSSLAWRSTEQGPVALPITQESCPGDDLADLVPGVADMKADDLDGDGRVDLYRLRAFEGQDDLSHWEVALNRGQGAFACQSYPAIGGRVPRDVLARAAPDGTTELLVLSTTSQQVVIDGFALSPDGLLPAPWSVSLAPFLGETASRLVLGELNGDGTRDLAVWGNRQVALLRGDDDRILVSAGVWGGDDVSIPVYFYGDGPMLFDYDGDGLDDAVYASSEMPGRLYFVHNESQ